MQKTLISMIAVILLIPALAIADHSKLDDVVYADHSDVPDAENVLKGDLYIPAGDGPYPAIMLMHGGAWQMGDENFYADDWGPWLAERGYTVFAIQYRLSKANRAYPSWPGCLLDSKAALRFLRGNAKQYKIDPNRIAVGGDSAGGQLAALLALTQNWPAYENRYSNNPYNNIGTEVQAVISAYGVFDLPAWWKWSKNPAFDWAPYGMTTFAEDLFGGTPMTLPAAYYEASALNHVRSAAQSQGEVMLANAGIKIPWFLTWGMEDPDVPPAGQSIPFVQALKEAGADVTTAPVPGVGHYWFNLGQITGQSGQPSDCHFDYKELKTICNGPTPNDYIAADLLRFLQEKL